MFLRRHLERLRHFVVHKILGVHDSPHRIALGVAIGIFVAWTPTIGFQMALTVLLATILRANKVVGVPIVWISNPATLWIYIPNYLLGCWLLREEPSTDRLVNALIQAFGVNDNGLRERFVVLVQTLWDVLAPLMLGSAIIAAILGAICYVATYQGVLAYHRWRRQVAPRVPGAEVSCDSPAPLRRELKAESQKQGFNVPAQLDVTAEGTKAGLELDAPTEPTESISAAPKPPNATRHR